MMTALEKPTAEQRQQMIEWMAARFIARTDASPEDAAQYAADVFDGSEDTDYEFTKESAHELVDGDLSCWGADEP
jgi:hypothetical protein